jgi:hypothetical protein
MANHLKLTAGRKADFLAALSLGSTATAAAGASGVALRTFYDHKGSDLRDAWEEAYREGTELLEDEARRRGAEGWDEPVYYQGRMGDGKDSCAILTQGPLYPGVTAVAEPATRRAAVRVAY